MLGVSTRARVEYHYNGAETDGSKIWWKFDDLESIQLAELLLNKLDDLLSLEQLEL